MKRLASAVLRLLLFPLTVLRWLGGWTARRLGRLFAPMLRKIDTSPRLSNMINSLSSSMATQRGLLLMIGTGIVALSLLAHVLTLVILVSAADLSRYLYWLCLPFALLHLGVLIGFTGIMLAVPLGQGYKNQPD